MSEQWHLLENSKVLSALQTVETGLSDKEAEIRLQRFGPNRLPTANTHKLRDIVVSQFSDVLILVLIAAALISGFIGDLEDTVAILCIVLLNALIGGVQQYRAEKAVSALRQMATPTAQVMRNGVVVTLDSEKLVAGDIVLLEAGMQVAADMRLLQAEQLEADESMLTGESFTVLKQVEAIRQEQAGIGDRTNMVFKNALITRGRGLAVVVATGEDTQIGRIAGLLSKDKQAHTPLQIRLARFSKKLAIAVIAICCAVFIAGLLQGNPVLTMLLTAVSLAVAAIPEALPAVITISLALGAYRLVRVNALVRHLPAVETLGSVTYICTDKTGTLTENRMHVDRILTSLGDYPNMASLKNDPVFGKLGMALVLNNDVRQGKTGPEGEPTELALYEAGLAGGFERKELDKYCPRIAELPFDSIRKRMTTIHQIQAGACENLTGPHDEKHTDLEEGNTVSLCKGAPDIVLKLCRFDDDNAHQSWLQRVEKLAAQGYRVLAVAGKSLPLNWREEGIETAETDLTLFALIALVDPPRKEAQISIQECHSAGITPVMITGDHPATAKAIAQRLGLAEANSSVTTGAELAQMKASLAEESFREQIASRQIFARVSPEQKLDIVTALQQNGEFVAMTGDGVNDAPAIRHANIGIAMGLKGTDVARNAADMVLLDDNFRSIVAAVRAGRRIYDNIRKFILYTMSSNAGEVLTLFLAPFLLLPIPLLPIHILWINIVTDGLPGLAYTTEPADPDVMKRAPRPPDENIFSHGMWQHIVWVGLLIAALSLGVQSWALSEGLAYWQTMVFCVLTFSQLFHALAVRSEKESLYSLGLFSNPSMLYSVLFTSVLQCLVIYVPFFNGVFSTQPLPLGDLILCVVLSSVVLFAVELEKLMVRKGMIYQSGRD